MSTIVSSSSQCQITFDDFEAYDAELPRLCESPDSIGSGTQIVTPEEEIDIWLLNHQPMQAILSHDAESTQPSEIRKVLYTMGSPNSNPLSRGKIAEVGSSKGSTGAPDVESIDSQFPLNCFGQMSWRGESLTSMAFIRVS